MSKKQLNKSTAKHEIIQSWSEGKTNQEIYFQLTNQYYDKKAIALLITGTTTEEIKRKYKPYNISLLILIAVTIILKVLQIVNLAYLGESVLPLLLVLIFPFFNILFFIGVAKYDAHSYRFCGFLALFGFFKSISNGNGNTDLVIGLIFCILITGLSFYLDAKLFPKYKPFNLAKDKNDEYIV
jgi:hypothetical protein